MSALRQATFGQRGIAAPAMAAAVPVQGEPAPKSKLGQPGFLYKLLGLTGEDDFDIRLREEYAKGKTLWFIIPLWLLFGGTGAHRFYLGHVKMGMAILGANMIIGFLMFSSIMQVVAAAVRGEQVGLHSFGGMAFIMVFMMLWVTADGIYIIVRKLIPTLIRVAKDVSADWLEVLCRRNQTFPRRETQWVA